GDEMESYSNLFMNREEMEAKIAEIKETLIDYNCLNAEIFSNQISQITDRGEILRIKKALEDSKSLYNIIRLVGDFELLERLDFRKLSQLRIMSADRMALLNAMETFQNNEELGNLLNVALEDILFQFTLKSSAEMILGDSLKDLLKKTREALGGNFDPRDPEWISLYEELRRLFEKKNLS